MSVFTAFEFALKLIFTNQEPAAFVWAFAAFLASFIILGLFWGLCWNHKWGVFGHWPSALMNGLFALGFALIVLAMFGAKNSPVWMERQREAVARQLTTSGTLNREIFRNAAKTLQPLGGQNELTPPAEGGMELRLNNAEEATVLAKEAASSVKGPLQSQLPFSFGMDCLVRDSATVADEVVAGIIVPAYPVIVSPDNEWSQTSVKQQINTAMDAAGKAVVVPMENLATSLTWTFALILLLQILLTALSAYRDIKENPSA